VLICGRPPYLAAGRGTLSEGQKKALSLGIAIALLVSRSALRNQGVNERPVSDAHAPIVGSLFGYSETARRRPIRRSIIGLRHAFAELLDFAARRFVKLFAIIRAPPVAHVTILVEFRSEEVETTAQLAAGLPSLLNK
jgi:hypothetical protein